MARRVNKPQDDKSLASDAYDYAANHGKSVREVATEGVVKSKEKPDEPLPAKEERKDSPPLQTPPAKSPLDEAREFIEREKTAIAETAKREAVEASQKALDEKLDSIKKSEISEKEKKLAIAEAKAKWTGFDPKTGTQTPKSYDEIVEEAVRIADERFETKYAEKRAREIEEYKREQEEAKTVQDRQKQEQDNYQKFVNDKIAGELEELYGLNLLTRPANPQDQNDPNTRATQDLFREAAEFNIKRASEGKAPIDSIAKYFTMYKPKGTKQPAGADAPIAGPSTVSPQPRQDKYDYAKNHNRSYRQIMSDFLKGRK